MTAPLSADPEAPSGAVPEPFACQFCDAPAAAACPRCGAFYCIEHGNAACDACSDPVSGLPAPWVAPVLAGALIVAVVAALWLLLLPPRLPGERPPAAEAVAPTTPALSPASPIVPRPARQSGPSASRAPEAAPAATPAAPAATGSTVEKYIIKQGDTLGAIAAQYGTTVDALRAANPGIEERSLQIGQEIVIPPR